MISASLRGFVIASALGVAAVLVCTSADALTENDILGKWCGTRNNPYWTNQIITHDTLTIVSLPSNGKKEFKIDSFKFGPDTAELFYFANQEGNAPGSARVSTTYTISSDSETMVESTQNGDYHFTRC
jgi:hypothetical protein